MKVKEVIEILQKQFDLDDDLLILDESVGERVEAGLIVEDAESGNPIIYMGEEW